VSYQTRCSFHDALFGKMITHISGLEKGNVAVKFETSDGKIYKMYHSQDCCESVSIEDVIGDVQDMLFSTVTLAEESIGDLPGKDTEWEDKSYTWTFYRIATEKGHVDIRWYGSSNGYYGEGVDIEDITGEQ
jgi:hypothetical protein